MRFKQFSVVFRLYGSNNLGNDVLQIYAINAFYYIFSALRRIK